MHDPNAEDIQELRAALENLTDTLRRLETQHQKEISSQEETIEALEKITASLTIALGDQQMILETLVSQLIFDDESGKTKMFLDNLAKNRQEMIGGLEQLVNNSSSFSGAQDPLAE